MGEASILDLSRPATGRERKMKRIKDYQFGRIQINEEDFRNDVIIFPDKVKDNWWREEGHNLHLKDLEEVITEEPEVLIIGTGAYGRVRVKDALKKELKRQGIKEVIVKETNKACQKFNQYIQSGKEVAAALHLTC